MSDLISRQAAIDTLETDAEMLKRVLDNTDIVGSERDKFAWGLGLIESCISDMKELSSAQPTEASCWGCNCPKMERLKEQKTFSEMVHLHDAEMHNKRTETHACDCISRQALMKEFSDFVRASNSSDFAQTPTWNDAVSLVGSMPSVQSEPIRINLNEPIKVKLTDLGKEIYYHQYDRINQIAGRKICEPRFPKVDGIGYTEFQLWCFIELYGEYMGMTMPNVIKPLEIVYER